MESKKIKEIFKSDPRIVKVVEYKDGFVPNSYKWPAHGFKNVYSLDGKIRKYGYDRKRSHGIGPEWVAFSDKDGRLASG